MTPGAPGHLDLIHGVEVLVGGPRFEGSIESSRAQENLWLLRVGGAEGPEAVLELQVDSCGLWVTMATSAHRPVVVRRAGWVELRGQVASDPLERWDRVGLGPGDALVFGLGWSLELDEVQEVLLARTDADAAGLSDGLHGSAHLVIRMPVFGPDEGARRASAATGLPTTAFRSPLHPPGSLEAELWEHRPAPPMEGRIRVAPVPASVPVVRGLLRRLVTSWRMAELLDGVLELLATEVLTNAIVHAQTVADVVIRYDGSALRFEVRDGDASVPAPQAPTEDGEGGRGLWLVAELADRWGSAVTPTGKRLWFELDVDGDGVHDAVVVMAHGILRAARQVDEAARELLSVNDELPPERRREALRLVRDRSRLVGDMLTDLVRGHGTS